MKILIINNKGDQLLNFQKCLSNYQYDMVSFNDITSNHFIGYDAIILSGGEQYEVDESPHEYDKELELIQKSNIPILGICLGLQMIAYAFGEKLMKLDKYYKEKTKVTIMKNDLIFESLPESFLAHVDHSWCVPNPKNFDILAVSYHCIEAIKHKTKPIYGVQFHPEIYCNEVQCEQTIINFLTIARTIKNKS